MARRPLSENERKLWSTVTRDVKPLRNDPETSEENKGLRSSPEGPRKPGRLIHSVKATTPEGRDIAPAQAVDHNWQQKLRRGRVPVEGKIDLHGMTQDRAYRALTAYIHRARAAGKRVILVVTGKGGPKRDLAQMSIRDFENRRGVLRDQVPNWLSSGEMRLSVVSFFAANREHGGEGALYVILRKAER